MEGGRERLRERDTERGREIGNGERMRERDREGEGGRETELGRK